LLPFLHNSILKVQLDAFLKKKSIKNQIEMMSNIFHINTNDKEYFPTHALGCTYLLKKRPLWWIGEQRMGLGMLLLVMLLNFLMPTCLHSSGLATITNGCLPM
jgi:hypothetical protein